MLPSTIPAEPLRNVAKVAHVTKGDKRLKITAKCKAALDLMVWEGLDWTEAARKAEFTLQAMRKALERAHVISYLKEQKQVFRACASAQNIHFATKMRADSGNAMAQLGAMKFIEQIDEQDQRAGSRSSAPGVLIVIGDKAVSVTAHERSIDDNPLISHTSGRDKPGQLVNDALHHDPLKGPGGG